MFSTNRNNIWESGKRTLPDGPYRFVFERIYNWVGITFEDKSLIAHVQHLREMKLADLYVAEPHIDVLPGDLEGEEVVLMDAQVAVAKADVVLLLVEHQTFNDINIGELAGEIVIDTRGHWTGIK